MIFFGTLKSYIQLDLTEVLTFLILKVISNLSLGFLKAFELIEDIDNLSLQAVWKIKCH